jgi:UTP--glucose-1-phosphate uridylyltransferase
VTPSFGPFEAKMRGEGLPDVVIATFRRYWEELAAGATGMLTAAEIEPVDRVPDSADLAGHEDRGAAALEKLVVVKLNGGLGTGMGMTRAKSLLPLRDGLTFLDLTARQILHLRERHGVRVPLVLMNSFRTRDDSLAALAAYPDLDAGLPADFLQHKVPKIRADDLSPAAWPAAPEHEWCPPGHGDLFTALVTSGLLDTLLARGLERAFVSNSDNLGAVPDLGILGWMAEEDVPFVMEVCDRTAIDRKGGHLARRRSDGALVLREVAQCPPEEMEQFQDVGRFRHFNTNNLWVDLRRLAERLRASDGFLGLPLIRNRKTVDPTDDSSYAVYQLETAMGSAIGVFDGARAVRVPRERFLPVKTTNDLLTVRSDVYETTDDHRVVPTPGREVGDLVVDLDPRYYRRVDQLDERFPVGPPSLANCHRFVVRGDVRFGQTVICLGDEITVEHDGPGQHEIHDGEVLT